MSTQWTLSKGFRCSNIIDQDGEEIGYIIDPDHAALCAAAPQLLEALSTLVRRIERDNLHTTHGVKLADARSAVAQAEGKE